MGPRSENNPLILPIYSSRKLAERSLVSATQNPSNSLRRSPYQRNQKIQVAKFGS